MTEVSERAELGSFPDATDGYRRELTAHCYRMTGSIHDAEDLVQETYLRAWKAYERFEGRSSVRTWLYRIATNVCLTAIEGKDRRPLPTGLGAPASDPSDPVVSSEISWLEPAPDPLVVSASADPATIVAERESIRLAFVAALQHLPARQRAVLILRDVLRWKASEVAEALETTEAAVNSALQRAHAQLAKADVTRDSVDTTTLDDDKQALLDRYVKAFWDKDIDTIVSMLTRDAVWEMPPFTGWYSGPQAIGTLIGTQCPGDVHDMPMLRTSANGQPAFGLYMRQPDGTFTPFHLQVLTLGDDGVSHVAAFFEPKLFETFGLPASLPADHTVSAEDR
jgi:RNA polymerase sigma-70 factor (ECF subfamily)